MEPSDGNSADREFHAHDGAASRCAQNRHMAALSLDHLLDEVKAQTRSRRSWPKAMERLEYPLAFLGRNAGAIVFHFQS
jgi:hypothetical protein